jgi:hypothetical protein
MRFCPNCGNPLGGSPRYCAGCATQVSAENETASAAAPGDPPPGDPGWAARHPSREPAQPPWPASGPPWPASPPPWPAGDPPWAASPPPWPAGDAPWAASSPPWPAGDAQWAASSPPWPAGDAPWAVSPGPAAEDQAAAVITESRGTSLPGAPRTARPDRRFGPYRRPRLSPGHGMTITAMLTTLALLGTLAAAAWQVGHIRSQAPAAGTSLAARASGTGRRAGTPDPGPSPARAAPSVSPGAPAASAVTVAPAAAGEPHVDRVVTLLDSYFSAINQHDFPAYRSLFIPAIRAGMHSFGASYQSTHDSRARLAGLAATGPQGLAATVTFVSHQNPAASPDHAACDRWHITLFIKRDGRGYHIRRHRPGFPADTVRACR